MLFNQLDAIESAGFSGFRALCELNHDPSLLPDLPGVYLVLRPEGSAPRFLQTGTGGFFKGKDPNVSLPELASNWVDQTIVLYIGKAGGSGSKATLRSRLKPYLDFGQGKKSPHRGGRLIWQLEDSAELVLCWKTLPGAEPRALERDLIRQFFTIYGKRPFANLTG